MKECRRSGQKGMVTVGVALIFAVIAGMVINTLTSVQTNYTAQTQLINQKLMATYIVEDLAQLVRKAYDDGQIPGNCPVPPTNINGANFCLTAPAPCVENPLDPAIKYCLNASVRLSTNQNSWTSRVAELSILKRNQREDDFALFGNAAREIGFNSLLGSSVANASLPAWLCRVLPAACPSSGPTPSPSPTPTAGPTPNPPSQTPTPAPAPSPAYHNPGTDIIHSGDYEASNGQMPTPPRGNKYNMTLTKPDCVANPTLPACVACGNGANQEPCVTVKFCPGGGACARDREVVQGFAVIKL